ncbi:UTRA domain-containing protein, partial [Thioclava sp. BHET1]
GQLGLSASRPLIRSRSLHFADRRPFLYEDRWINPAALPMPLPADPQSISVNEWLVETVAYTYGDISFSAANAHAEEAAHLDVAAGTALFIVERTTWAGDAPVTSVRLAYAPGYRLHTVV